MPRYLVALLNPSGWLVEEIARVVDAATPEAAAATIHGLTVGRRILVTPVDVYTVGQPPLTLGNDPTPSDAPVDVTAPATPPAPTS